MKEIILYRYSRPDGGITTSPNKPDTAEYTIKYRLVADEGYTLTNGDITADCVDTDNKEGWREVESDNVLYE